MEGSMGMEGSGGVERAVVGGGWEEEAVEEEVWWKEM